jgi:hypothetical protein
MAEERPNDFDLFIGLILARLYQGRGTRPTLSPEDFGLFDPEDPTGHRWEVWANTFGWLEAEGYVRHAGVVGGTENEPCFTSAELTERGFRALNSFPKALIAKGDHKVWGRSSSTPQKNSAPERFANGPKKGSTKARGASLRSCRRG